MARDGRNQRWARAYLWLFGALIAADAALAGAHAGLFARAWADRDRERLLELCLCAAHFVSNTIAIADIFVHLLRFDKDDQCAFEPAKSTNAFLFSCIGAYADLTGVAYSEPGGGMRAYGWALVAVSLASAAVSIACYVWGTGTIRVCETSDGQEQPPRPAPRLRSARQWLRPPSI